MIACTNQVERDGHRIFVVVILVLNLHEYFRRVCQNSSIDSPTFIPFGVEAGYQTVLFAILPCVPSIFEKLSHRLMLLLATSGAFIRIKLDNSIIIHDNT
jgi:hypothetical protein